MEAPLAAIFLNLQNDLLNQEQLQTQIEKR